MDTEKKYFDTETHEALLDGLEVKSMMQYILTGNKDYMMLVNVSRLARSVVKSSLHFRHIKDKIYNITGLKPDDFICPKGVCIGKEINTGMYQVKLS